MDSDPWDSLLHLEEKAFQEGVAEGAKESQEASEARQEGVVSGFRHGFAFHMEVAYMETITRSILRKQEIGSTDCNLTSCTKNGHNKERIKKKCMQFLSRLEGIPTSNAQDVDFVTLLKELQLSYRSIEPHVPPFTVETPSKIDW